MLRFRLNHLIQPRAGASRRAMVLSAAAMYGGATFVGLVEAVIPGGPQASVVPGLAALVFVTGLLLFGQRLPVAALAALGPIGATFIAVALATTHGPGDGAVLYVWPVLWQSYFFGRAGTVLIVAWIGVVHAAALLMLPDGLGYVDRWLDVMVVMIVAGGVVDALSARSERLLEQHAADARLDPLTGLLNRRGLDEAAGREAVRARRARSSLVVVSFDIDHFKRINDEWGHEAGDTVLARLGAILREQSRAGDLVARVGGEEFVALLTESDSAAAVEFAERVRAHFAAIDDLGLPTITLSAGVASVPQDLEALLRRADFALYAAKRGGRDRVVVDDKPAVGSPPRAVPESARRG